MLSKLLFPDVVTNPTDQSYTLGVKLNNLLSGATPQIITQSPSLLKEVLQELWQNLPCLTDESIIRCLPIYIAINNSYFGIFSDDDDVADILQLKSDLADRLALIGDRTLAQNEVALLNEATVEERENIFNFCVSLETEFELSLAAFKSSLMRMSFKMSEN